MNIETKVSDLIKKSLNEINLELVSVNYEKEHNNNFLRIVIDNEIGVDLDTCVAATKVINELLDSENIITDEYILDVCSKEKGGN
jgi:ribosome maturation factor RimP